MWFTGSCRTILARSVNLLYSPPVKPIVIIVPVVIVLSGAATALMIPAASPLFRAALFASDCFGAVAVGLVLWRKNQP